MSLPDILIDANAKNPAKLVRWPFMLPIELALKTAPTRDICESYGIDEQEWSDLRKDEGFRRAVAEAVEMVKKDGYSARAKFKMVSESLIPEIYKIATNPDVPWSIRLDAIKQANRCAGHDGEAKLAVPQGQGFQVVFNFGTHDQPAQPAPRLVNP